MKRKQEMKKIVGLKYEPTKGAPEVIVKSSGPIVEEIIRLGRSTGHMHVIEDAALTEELFKLPVDAQIGPELFELVAILLAHVFRVDQQAGRGTG